MNQADGPSWKSVLESRIPAELGREIDVFETELELRRQGGLGEKVFAETRLRRGVYGQRYDNGLRHDGRRSRKLAYPSGEVLKGPNTLWDAPGMQRIKIPFGGITADQMDVLADCAEEYADGVLHVTTRQDFQLHFVHIDDTPDLMRRLAAVGVTTREACGNSVRNVTACPLAGVCRSESFDVTPYARALARFLLGHPDAQDFGRKFKISFSGCKEASCGLASFHDLGFIARIWEEGGRMHRGFELYVGGGLGAVPYQAKLFAPRLPAEEVLPMAQAVCRVFARFGEKRNRARARLKFLVDQWGIDEFRRRVLEERDALAEDPRWRAIPPGDEPAEVMRGERLDFADEPGTDSEGFASWLETNAYPQRQSGYAAVVVTLPLGDLNSRQLRGVAELARRFGDGGARNTVDQNMLLRWVPQARLPDLHTELSRLGLGEAGAGTIVDVTACPGTDTCKLGIASSRGLAAEIRSRLLEQSLALDRAVRNLHIKVSGCFNSCGQHHAADLGFYGVSRNIEGRTVPHFQVVLGGQWTENAKSFGLAVGAVPSKRIPEVVRRVTGAYRDGAEPGESFQSFVKRLGRARIRALFDDLVPVPSYAQDRSLYSDWGDPREFSLGDLGKGECAGEVVSPFEFALAASEREVFEAQVRWESGDSRTAAETAYRAMLGAARALVSLEAPGAGAEVEPDAIAREFRTRFYDTRRFHDPFAGGKFAHYFFRAHEEDREALDRDQVERRIEEARLFIEAAHACRARCVAATSALSPEA